MSAVLTREAIPGFQRWELPQVGDAAPAAAREPALPTVAELEALEREAREQGYAAGQREGLAAAQQQLAARMAQLDALYASAARPLQALDEATEQELAQLALAVARQVVAHELKSTPELIVPAIRQAATALPSATRELRVRLHPDDAALLRELGAAESHWQIHADPALARGDCVLESERSRLDARLRTRLAAVIDAVLGDEADDSVEDEA
ncbi:flagellar assembly protein FliH [Frateuria sp. Soil773]|uniref:FliH/SctL family protein n=1 Tax=Frateuria sp. Soil773 TaxID=1736407 RepID=UPI0006F41266|nr:FliH/SctL family protein [Frateuria sp. Soil773]KRE90913.1 flagellar assembly protein FliH [Frateuria sp. Soil773]